MGVCCAKTTAVGDRSEDLEVVENIIEIPQEEEEKEEIETDGRKRVSNPMDPCGTKSGWSVDGDGRLTYYVLIDSLEGKVFIKKLEKYPKLANTKFECYIEVGSQIFKGGEMVSIAFKHDQNDFLKIERSVREFYLTMLCRRRSLRKAVILGMDPFHPVMSPEEYLQRGRLFLENKVRNFYHTVKTKKIPKPVVQAPTFLKAPISIDYYKLPVSQRRSPGWECEGDHIKYYVISSRSDKFLKRLCQAPSTGVLKYGCEGELYRNRYQGQEVIIVMITHKDNIIPNIYKAMRSFISSGIPEGNRIALWTHADPKMEDGLQLNQRSIENSLEEEYDEELQEVAGQGDENMSPMENPEDMVVEALDDPDDFPASGGERLNEEHNMMIEETQRSSGQMENAAGS